MNIVLLEDLSINDSLLNKYIDKILSLGHTFTKYEKTNDPSLQSKYCEDADVIILANSPLFKETIENAKNLKYIDIAFTGVDHVPIELAKSKNIKISNASGYSTTSVTELCISFMIQLLRNTKQVEERCRNSQTKDGLVGSTLSGKTVGIIGYGKIGSNVAKVSSFLGANVLVNTRRNIDDFPNVSLDELLRESDIVSLHCPLTADTEDLLTFDKLRLMKPSSYIINTARGGIIDKKALIKALENNIIAGAALDVFDIEPPLSKDDIILNTKNLILTPHIAYATKESMILRAEITFNNLFSWLNGSHINKV